VIQPYNNNSSHHTTTLGFLLLDDKLSKYPAFYSNGLQVRAPIRQGNGKQGKPLDLQENVALKVWQQ